VQVVQYFCDNKTIKPSDFMSDFAYQDSTALPNGSHVDHVRGETTPGYQQGSSEGRKNGVSQHATMTDAPTTDGGDKGFYDATKNPNGWKKIVKKFETFAWCMQGTDCGKWYEGVKWEYTKTWEDNRDGKLGTSVLTDNNVATPSQNFLDAFDKFNNDKKFTPCK
jgi:hypothetical protein